MLIVFINPRAERDKIKIKGSESKEIMQKEIAEFNKQDKTQIIEGENTKSWFFEAIKKINKSQL